MRHEENELNPVVRQFRDARVRLEEQMERLKAADSKVRVWASEIDFNGNGDPSESFQRSPNQLPNRFN